MISKGANGLGESVRITQLEEGVAGMRRQPGEQVRAQHRGHHRAVAATRLTDDAAVTRLWQRAVVTIDPGHDLIAQVGVVLAGTGRVEVLAAAQGGPAVDSDDEAGRRTAGAGF